MRYYVYGEADRDRGMPRVWGGGRGVRRYSSGIDTLDFLMMRFGFTSSSLKKCAKTYAMNEFQSVDLNVSAIYNVELCGGVEAAFWWKFKTSTHINWAWSGMCWNLANVGYIIIRTKADEYVSLLKSGKQVDYTLWKMVWPPDATESVASVSPH